MTEQQRDSASRRIEIILRDSFDFDTTDLSDTSKTDILYFKLLLSQLKKFHKPDKAKHIARVAMVKYILKEFVTEKK